MCTGTSCTLILNPTGEPPCLPANLALASSRKSSLRISTQKIFRPKRLALKTSMPGAAPAQIASKGFAQDQAPQTVFARPLQAPASESSQSCKLNRPSRLPPMALTRPICRLKCLRFVSLRSLPFSRHVLFLHKEWDVREKGERKDFLPSFLFFRLFQVSCMPLSSKPCASSPAQSRHLRTNGHIGASDCKASFNVLAGRRFAAAVSLVGLSQRFSANLGGGLNRSSLRRQKTVSKPLSVASAIHSGFRTQRQRAIDRNASLGGCRALAFGF